MCFWIIKNRIAIIKYQLQLPKSHIFAHKCHNICISRAHDINTFVIMQISIFNAALLFLQVALRRQQAQEMEMGLYHPVNLSGLEVLVKTENGSDCMVSGEAQALSPISGNSSAHAVTGEIMALFFFLCVPACLRATLHSVESKNVYITA